METPLTEEQVRARSAKVPELRIKPDISIVADDRTTAAEVVGRLATEDIRSVYVQIGEGKTRADAVVVPVARYLDLVGRNLANSNEIEALADGRIVPAGLAHEDVETIDPNATWAT